jgi:hypothetical protein
MFRISMHWRFPVFLLAAVTLAAAAGAQTTTPPAQASDPANPQAAVPRAVHSSAFAGYRRHAEPAPIAWKDANDTVTRVGGWRAYAREAAEPSAPAASTPPRRTAP